MMKPVEYTIIDCPDGRFAVVAVGAGLPHWRSGFRTLAEAEASAEELRAIMAACGAPLVHATGQHAGPDPRISFMVGEAPC